MKKKKISDVRELSDEEIAFRKTRRKNIGAFIVCLIIAFFLWLSIMNAENPVVKDEGASNPTPTAVFADAGAGL